VRIATLALYALAASTLVACAAQTTPPSAPQHVASASANAPAPRALPACKPGADWNEPAPALHVYGNTWYVGTCGITALLVTSPAGHVLLDGATAKAAPLIEASIRSLGFRVEDVKFILTTHAHFDHVGGFAKLAADSGAVVVSRGADADALEHGHGDRRDPQELSVEAFSPVARVRRVNDGETLKVGDLVVTAHATPGHTQGGTSWTWDSCEAAACRHVVYADSVNAISDDVYRYGDEAAHPGVLAAFQATLATVAALPCDILLTPHPDGSDMWLRLGAQPSEKLVDTDACRRYAAGGRERLEVRLAKERAGTK